MNGDPSFDDLGMLDRLLEAGVPFHEAWPAVTLAVMRANWRGADEPIQTLGPDSGDEPTEVWCICGTRFAFKAGATRARCPGCGCRYELSPRQWPSIRG